MLFRLIERRIAKVLVVFLLTLSLPVVYVLNLLSLSGKTRLGVISLFLLVFALTPIVFNKYGWINGNSINNKIHRYKNSALERSKWSGIGLAVISVLCVAFWSYLVGYLGLISIQLPILALAYFILEYSLIEFSTRLDINDER